MWGARPGASPHGSVASSVQSQEEVRLQTPEEQRAAPTGVVFAPRPGEAAAAPAVVEHAPPAGVKWGPTPEDARAPPPRPPPQPVADRVAAEQRAPPGVVRGPASAAVDAGARPRASAQGQDRPAGLTRGAAGSGGDAQPRAPVQAADMARPRPRLQAPPPPGWAQQQYQRLGLFQADGSDGRLPPAAQLPVAPRLQQPPPRYAAAPQPQPSRPPRQAAAPLVRAPSGASGTSAASAASSGSGTAAGGEEPKKRGLLGRLKRLVPHRDSSKNGNRGTEQNQCAPTRHHCLTRPFACRACQMSMHAHSCRAY